MGDYTGSFNKSGKATDKESLTVGQQVIIGKGRQQGTITEVGDGFVKAKMGGRIGSAPTQLLSVTRSTQRTVTNTNHKATSRRGITRGKA